MTPDEAIAKAQGGEIYPVYLVAGEEQFSIERVISALRTAVLGGGIAQFNEEKVVAGEVAVDRVLSAARMVPMMAKQRLIVVRSLERWDSRAASDDDDDDESAAGVDSTQRGALDRLADYAQAPIASTCLVLVATKIDGRRKLMTLARKGNWLVACEPLPRAALPSFVVREAEARGHTIDMETADLLAELVGPELSSVADALERLSLYVGKEQPIGEEAIAMCLIRLRQSTVWELINAVGKRDLGVALTCLEDVYDPRDRGLRLIALLAWSMRQLIKFDSAVRAGAGPEEAAKRAGAPPFKARELAAQVRALSPGDLERWLLLLADADLELKGSKLPARSTVEDTIVQMCRSGA